MEQLTVYVREACGLCEELMEELAPLAGRYGFTVEQVDVDRDPELAGRYGDRVPVLTGARGEICHYFLDEEALARYFAGR